MKPPIHTLVLLAALLLATSCIPSVPPNAGPASVPGIIINTDEPTEVICGTEHIAIAFGVITRDDHTYVVTASRSLTSVHGQDQRWRVTSVEHDPDCGYCAIRYPQPYL